MQIRSTYNFTKENFNTSLNQSVEFYFKQEDFKITSEILNPYNCEGYAIVSIQVNDKGYRRTFEDETPDIRIVNFVTKFINNKEYRERFSIERNRHTNANTTNDYVSDSLKHSDHASK